MLGRRPPHRPRIHPPLPTPGRLRSRRRTRSRHRLSLHDCLRPQLIRRRNRRRRLHPRLHLLRHPHRAAGAHFAGYDDTALAKTPTVYLVPAGADCFRAVGDPDTILSWNVVDQVIPAPYAIGASQLDDPDWTPLYTGYTSGADPGAKIRKHPSFRAYYASTNEPPSDTSLDCPRLVGRSAWNTQWLLIIPAGSPGSDRETALSTFVNGRNTDRDGTPDTPGITDILLGLKTYSLSGNYPPPSLCVLLSTKPPPPRGSWTPPPSLAPS